MDFSPITDELFIGKTPTAHDYNQLRDMGVRLVINMRIEQRPARDPHDPPLELLWLPTFDTPFIPIPIRSLMQGAKAALETIRAGGRVYSHCAQGIHRGVAMGAAILIARGLPVEEAMRLIKSRRTVADPYIFYIRGRIQRFARQWQGLGFAS